MWRGLIASDQCFFLFFVLVVLPLSLRWIMSPFTSLRKTRWWLRRRPNPSSTTAFGCSRENGSGCATTVWPSWLSSTGEKTLRLTHLKSKLFQIDGLCFNAQPTWCCSVICSGLPCLKACPWSCVVRVNFKIPKAMVVKLSSEVFRQCALLSKYKPNGIMLKGKLCLRRSSSNLANCVTAFVLGTVASGRTCLQWCSPAWSPSWGSCFFFRAFSGTFGFFSSAWSSPAASTLY